MENIINNPVIGVVMCGNRFKDHATQTLQEKYPSTIIHASSLPVALPRALTEPSLSEQLLSKLDGIYPPGSPSNVQPYLYGEDGDEPDADPGCDLLSMALINVALERRTPIFAICRGLRRLMVVTGGSLHCKLCEQPELLEHRENPELPMEQQYVPSHEVQVEEGGLLLALLPECSNFWVDLLHRQGVKVANPRLRAEAYSPDGLVEAANVIGRPFALGVQWHPGWNSGEYAPSHVSFEGFIIAYQYRIAEK